MRGYASDVRDFSPLVRESAGRHARFFLNYAGKCSEVCAIVRYNVRKSAVKYAE